MQFLGIDVGTTYIKAGVLNVDEFTLGPMYRTPAPPPLADERGILHEIKADDFVRTVQEVIARMLPASHDCQGIVMCGQMGGLVLTDGAGRAVSNYISWLDRRSTVQHPDGGSYFERFCRLVGPDWSERLGNEVRPGLPLPFLFCLQQNGTLPADATPVTLPDYVAARLCHARPVMEWTSSTSMIDVARRSWPRKLLETLGLSELCLPRLVDFRYEVGECDVQGRTLPVYAAVGDHQCALAGARLQAGELSINVSTGSQVAMIADNALVGDFQLRPYFDGQHLKTVTNIPAGRALAALVRLLTEIPAAQGLAPNDPWAYAFQQAEALNETDLRTNLAFFPGAVPGPGQLDNLHESNLTVGHVFRSALGQMAEYYDTFATRLAPERSWTRLVFSGGIAQRSGLLRRLICDRLGSDHRLTSSSEDTLLGLLVLARVVSGRNATVQEACQFGARS